MSLSDTFPLQAENRRLEAELVGARDALEATQVHYRSLFAQMDSGFCLIRMRFAEDGRAEDYCFVETNASFERHTGLANVTGRWMRELAPNHEQHWFDVYGEIARTGQSQRFVDHAHALCRWFEVSAARVSEAGGDLVAVLFTDITAQFLSEQALRLSDRLAELTEAQAMAFEAATTLAQWLGLHRAGYCVYDAAGEVLEVNRDWYCEGLHSLAGRHRPEAFGDFLDALRAGEVVVVDDVTRDSRITDVPRLVGDGIGAFISYPLVERGQLMAVMYVATGEPRTWSQEQMGFIREVALRTHGAMQRCFAEQQLRELNATLEETVRERTAALVRSEEQLRQSQKMEAVGQLTGGIAHDFNNLLTGISGSLEMLQARLAQGRMQGIERYMETAQVAARRAAALTHRLLAFARRQTLDPRPTDLNTLVAGMEELIRRTMGPAVEIEIHLQQPLWAARVDAHQLENALLNLCINARDAMPEGGKLWIETCHASPPEDGEGPPGDYVALCVRDSGSGMAADVLNRAFEPFFTTKALGMGTGLGLSMIYGFTRQSGGKAHIESTPEVGTAVWLYLPRDAGEASAPDAMPHAPVTHTGRGQTVLVVDDEASIRGLVSEVLDQSGYVTVEACDGASGLRILESNLPVDLLITDVGMPGGMSGPQMVALARKVRPQLKVLFITGYAEQALTADGPLGEGMYSMSKPFSLQSLNERIRELLQG